nr:hypothetical protein [Tanacetum cinerariifolium]
MTKSDREDIIGLKTCSANFSLLDGSTDPEMVDLCASMVDPSRAVSAYGPTKLIGLVLLVDALLLSNPKPSNYVTFEYLAFSFGRGRGYCFGNKGGESSKQKRACYNCGIEDHFASECRKLKENKDFVGGAWSDSEDGNEPKNKATCLMAIDPQEVCLKCDQLPDNRIVDSGCTKHITRNRRLFTLYKAYDGGHCIFGSNLKGKVVDEGSQGNENNRTRNDVSTSRVLEFLDLDLFGLSPNQSYKGNFYTLTIVDDHSNYTWVVFVESKDDDLEKFKILSKRLENLHDCSIVSIVTN